MLLAYNTNGFANHDPEQAIDLLARIGYRGVGLTIDHGLLNPLHDGPKRARSLATVHRLLVRHHLRSVVETGVDFCSTRERSMSQR